MRKVLVLVVAAAVASVGAGLALSAGSAAAITVNGATISGDQLNRELRAIDASPLFQCFLEARTLVSTDGQQSAPALTTGSGAWSTGAIVEWGDIRVTQLLAEAYVEAHDPGALVLPAATTPAALAATKQGAVLAGKLTSSFADATELASTYSCPAAESTTDPGAATLTSLPLWFDRAQLKAQLALDAIASLVPQVGTSRAALRTWYGPRAHEFDTICASAVIADDEADGLKLVHLINTHRLTIEQAAVNPKWDVSSAQVKAKGSIGCYAPSNASYADVTHYLGSLGVGVATSFPSSTIGYVVVAATKRTTNAFDTVVGSVLARVNAQNAAAVAGLLTTLQRSATVTVDQAIGRWVPNSLGGTIEPPAAPPLAGVSNPEANASS